ncbi:multi antimicrobial extrusion protein MatE [Paenibacillus lutrae]
MSDDETHDKKDRSSPGQALHAAHVRKPEVSKESVQIPGLGKVGDPDVEPAAVASDILIIEEEGESDKYKGNAKPHHSMKETVTFWKMLIFFVPLGISASLVTLSHSIINSTLARSPDPEYVIAGYAIAMSLLGITEKPATLLRQTCSALVRDRVSFRAMRTVAVYVFAAIMIVGLAFSYLPPGRLMIGAIFGIGESQLENVLNVYRILMFVSFFSGLRCLYHGLIIYNKRTFWLTIGMVVRLIGMYAVAQFFILGPGVQSSSVGAIIFLVGMMIESAVAFWEGSSLLKRKIPEKSPGHSVEKPADVFRFYRPLLFSSFIAVTIGPALNAMLGKAGDAEIAIAAFAIAFNLTQLMQSFFSYIHQIVLNFYRINPGRVNTFVLMIACIPSVLVGILAYTEAGPWFLSNVIGVSDRLLTEIIKALRVFLILTLVFPWLDYGNGILMLRRQTKTMVYSQSANVSIMLSTLIILIVLTPGWNGMIGAFAQSLGTLAELTVVMIAVKRGRESVLLRPSKEA